MPHGGGGGLGSVSHDGTLSGSGTGSSPLGIVTPVAVASGGTGATAGTRYISAISNNVATNFNFSATILIVWGFYLEAPVKVSNGITMDIGTADNAHNYAVGLYNSSGALVLHSAPAGIPATGLMLFAPTETLPLTLGAGLYFFGMTGASAVAAVAQNGGTTTWPPFYCITNSINAVTPGTMNASITPPARSPLLSSIVLFMID